MRTEGAVRSGPERAKWQTRLLTVASLFAFVAVTLGMLAGAWSWMLTWGATPAEVARALPGDDEVPDPAYRATWAVSIAAPPREVWAWLSQIGQDKAAFYSNDWAENLVAADYHNGNRLVPEWQRIAPGDVVRSVPVGYFGGVLEEQPGWTVEAAEPGRLLVLRGFGTWLLEPEGDGHTRLIMRIRDERLPVLAQLADAALAVPLHFFMSRRMLLGIRERAEGVPFVPRPVHVAADVGFALTAAAVARFLALRGRWPWLLPGLAWALGVVARTGDFRSAAVAFLAPGLLATVAFAAPRGWRTAAVLGVVDGMLAVLLFAPDAWSVFGVLGALGAIALSIRRLGRARRETHTEAAAN